jgi:polyhydroxyalkanoate synthesis repressor PhaR
VKSNSGEAESSVRRLEIKKYPNRRYYDTTHSRHLTLEEIRDLVRDGHDIRVEDSKTGAEITSQVLTQIILELETPKLENFPVHMLVQMIRANERVVGDFIQKYFTQAFAAYLEYQRQMEEHLRHFHAMPGALNPFATFAPGVFNPFSTATGAKPAPGASPTSSQTSDETRALIAELQKQIAVLQQEISRQRRNKRP